DEKNPSEVGGGNEGQGRGMSSSPIFSSTLRLLRKAITATMSCVSPGRAMSPARLARPSLDHHD
ncbi:Uncharacterized protein DAT39_015147, partial [Clarias magur]